MTATTKPDARMIILLKLLGASVTLTPLDGFWFTEAEQKHLRGLEDAGLIRWLWSGPEPPRGPSHWVLTDAGERAVRMG